VTRVMNTLMSAMMNPVMSAVISRRLHLNTTHLDSYEDVGKYNDDVTVQSTVMIPVISTVMTSAVMGSLVGTAHP
jgi:hypothetical protein